MAATDDIRLTYPVFLPEPNWKNGVTERLEWMTDVLSSETGAEQRRKLRLTPRRSFEATFMRWGENRGLLDSTLVGIGQGLCLLPLWHDKTKIDNDVPAGSIDIFGDFAYRDFNVGDVVIIRRDSIFDYELNIVAGRDDTALTLAFGTESDSLKGHTISPIRVSQMRDTPNSSMLTDAVSLYQIRFYNTEIYRLPPEWGFPVYPATGLPIMTREPNYRSDISASINRNTYVLDGGMGPVHIVDPGKQSSTTQKFSFQLVGREAAWKFRQMLFAMSGMQNEFHIPTGASDFELAEDIDPAKGAIIVYRSGFSQFLNTRQVIRRDILIEMYDGTQVPATIVSSRIVGNVEWLVLTQTLGNISKDDIRRISYMPRGRLDTDSVEFNRLTDSDGASETSLTFKAFAERRNAPPIPIT